VSTEVKNYNNSLLKISIENKTIVGDAILQKCVINSDGFILYYNSLNKSNQSETCLGFIDTMVFKELENLVNEADCNEIKNDEYMTIGNHTYSVITITSSQTTRPIIYEEGNVCYKLSRLINKVNEIMNTVKVKCDIMNSKKE
jgi:hypothetical protein